MLPCAHRHTNTHTGVSCADALFCLALSCSDDDGAHGNVLFLCLACLLGCPGPKHTHTPPLRFAYACILCAVFRIVYTSRRYRLFGTKVLLCHRGTRSIGGCGGGGTTTSSFFADFSICFLNLWVRRVFLYFRAKNFDTGRKCSI